MDELSERLAVPRFGEARVETGDPLCDHIWRSPNPLAEGLLWLECMHCESTIQVMFYGIRQLPGGAS